MRRFINQEDNPTMPRNSKGNKVIAYFDGEFSASRKSIKVFEMSNKSVYSIKIINIKDKHNQPVQFNALTKGSLLKLFLDRNEKLYHAQFISEHDISSIYQGTEETFTERKAQNQNEVTIIGAVSKLGENIEIYCESKGFEQRYKVESIYFTKEPKIGDKVRLIVRDGEIIEVTLLSDTPSVGFVDAGKNISSEPVYTYQFSSETPVSKKSSLALPSRYQNVDFLSDDLYTDENELDFYEKANSKAKKETKLCMQLHQDPVKSAQIPIPIQPAQVPIQPAQVPIQPAKVPIQPAQVPIQPAQVPVQPAQVPIQPAQVPIQPAQVPVQQAKVPQLNPPNLSQLPKPSLSNLLISDSSINPTQSSQIIYNSYSSSPNPILDLPDSTLSNLLHSPIKTISEFRLPIYSLKLYYPEYLNYHKRVDVLSSSYRSWRRSTDDGNSFYRSLGSSYLEYLCSNSTDIHELEYFISRLNNLPPNITSVSTYLHELYQIKQIEGNSIYRLQQYLKLPSFDISLMESLRKLGYIYLSYFKDLETYKTALIDEGNYTLNRVQIIGEDAQNEELMLFSDVLGVIINKVTVFKEYKVQEFKPRNASYISTTIHLLKKSRSYNVLYTQEQNLRDQYDADKMVFFYR